MAKVGEEAEHEDELTFLHWVYKNAVRDFWSAEELEAIHRDYEDETGEQVPDAYRIDNSDLEETLPAIRVPDTIRAPAMEDEA